MPASPLPVTLELWFFEARGLHVGLDLRRTADQQAQQPYRPVERKSPAQFGLPSILPVPRCIISFQVCMKVQYVEWPPPELACNPWLVLCSSAQRGCIRPLVSVYPTLR